MEEFIVALDGPAGSGKSTIAKKIAERYGLTYLDTGAMYRMITLYFLQEEIPWSDEKECLKALQKVRLDMREGKFLLNGRDVTEEIRSPRVNDHVSEVSALKVVRQEMVSLQREISKGKRVILDGRDIGTVVFPEADVKIYLVASPEERAKRRYLEYQQKGEKISLEEVLTSIQKRDQMDSTRKESPLRKAEDAIEIDSSFLSIEEVIEKIADYMRQNEEK